MVVWAFHRSIGSIGFLDRLERHATLDLLTESRKRQLNAKERYIRSFEIS